MERLHFRVIPGEMLGSVLNRLVERYHTQKCQVSVSAGTVTAFVNSGRPYRSRPFARSLSLSKVQPRPPR